MNSKKTSLPISKLLKEENLPIAHLYEKAKSIQELDNKLKKYLDPSLHNHFQLANIKTDSVVILVSSSTWATRLRYNIPAILETLNNQLNLTTIKTVRVKVKTVTSENKQTPKNRISLSESSAQILRDVADNFNDPELRNCFIKLSKNYDKFK